MIKNPKLQTKFRPAFQNKVNLQVPDQEFYKIPIVNGFIKSPDNKKCDSLSNLSKPTHKIVLSGDSHIKGFATELQTVMTSKYKLLSVVKPGSNSNMLSESITETIKELSNDDVLIICCGTNDYESDNFKSTFQNISSLMQTNILVLGIPFRYDLLNSTMVNSEICKINKKLSKLANTASNIGFLDSDNDSKLFTKHGLHRNKYGKQLIVTQIANFILSIFNQKSLPPISLAWYTLTEVSIDENEKNNIKRNSSRPRKIPVTRSEDFLW